MPWRSIQEVREEAPIHLLDDQRSESFFMGSGFAFPGPIVVIPRPIVVMFSFSSDFIF
jgi:hypothetical protein